MVPPLHALWLRGALPLARQELCARQPGLGEAATSGGFGGSPLGSSLCQPTLEAGCSQSTDRQACIVWREGHRIRRAWKSKGVENVWRLALFTERVVPCGLWVPARPRARERARGTLEPAHSVSRVTSHRVCICVPDAASARCGKREKSAPGPHPPPRGFIQFFTRSRSVHTIKL